MPEEDEHNSNLGDTASLPPGVRLSRLEAALREAADIDAIVRSLFDHLTAQPFVHRVGLALTEGAGRRLRFTASDDADAADELAWCHIDAYDDVPLTTVARTGETIAGSLEQVAERYPALAGHAERYAVRSLASLPLPGVGSPVGGLVVLYDADVVHADCHRALETAARRVAEAIRRVRATVGRATTDPAPDDHVPGDGGRRVALTLEHDPRSAGRARRFLRQRLTEWGVDEDSVDGAQLCLSELVTNAIIHTHASSELVVHLEDDVLTVVVRDVGVAGSRGAPATYAPVPDDDPLRVFGRGLTLVDAIADRWGSEQDTAGTTAWFALDLAAHPAPESTTATTTARHSSLTA